MDPYEVFFVAKEWRAIERGAWHHQICALEGEFWLRWSEQVGKEMDRRGGRSVRTLRPRSRSGPGGWVRAAGRTLVPGERGASLG